MAAEMFRPMYCYDEEHGKVVEVQAKPHGSGQWKLSERPGLYPLHCRIVVPVGALYDAPGAAIRGYVEAKQREISDLLKHADTLRARIATAEANLDKL